MGYTEERRAVYPAQPKLDGPRRKKGRGGGAGKERKSRKRKKGKRGREREREKQALACGGRQKRGRRGGGWARGRRTVWHGHEYFAGALIYAILCAGRFTAAPSFGQQRGIVVATPASLLAQINTPLLRIRPIIYYVWAFSSCLEEIHGAAKDAARGATGTKEVEAFSCEHTGYPLPSSFSLSLSPPSAITFSLFCLFLLFHLLLLILLHLHLLSIQLFLFPPPRTI